MANESGIEYEHIVSDVMPAKTCELLDLYEKIINDPELREKCGDILPSEAIPFFTLQSGMVSEGIPKKVYRDLVSIHTARSVEDPKTNEYTPQLRKQLFDKLQNRDATTTKTSVYRAMTAEKTQLVPHKYTETDLTNDFITALKAEGREVSTRKHCDLGGKIDLFVLDPEPQIIIELKLKVDFNSVTCAMGQLQAYGDSFFGALQYFGSDCDVPYEFKKMLSKRSIKTVKLNKEGKLEWSDTNATE